MNNNTTKTVIALVGATASGKTDLGIALAERFKTYIISSDSRQFYREMRIGTAMPTAEELMRVPHFMIGNRSIQEDYSCGEYETEALGLFEKLFKQRDIVFLVGGSGLYIDAICKGMDVMPDIDPKLRPSLTQRLETEGVESLFNQLQDLDPEHATQIDRNNPQRIIRALEVCLSTGQPYSTYRTGVPKERPFRVVKIGITMPRELLYKRINQRVEMMLSDGLEVEAQGLYVMRHLNALQTVGYQEFFDYFSGTISRDEAIELIKRNSRRYAKRQETWFGRDQDILWFERSPSTVDSAEKYLRELLQMGTQE